MYIQPDTQIRILKNVPLDPTYDHTIWFPDEAHQVEFFSSKTKYTLNDQTYQRVQRGYMRVEVRAEKLYDCNYLMFQNSAFGNKWFYAFITAVEYVNNEVSEIAFEIDVMQTWFFNYTLDKCFVDREHSATDILFDNLVNENLDLGDGYVCNHVEQDHSPRDLAVAILVSEIRGGGDNWIKPAGLNINNVYTPVNGTNNIKVSDTVTLDAFIDDYVNAGKEDSIIAIWEYPRWITDSSSDRTKPTTISMRIQANLTSIGGYVPRNKKLFMYPYNFLQVSDNSGKVAEYHWEDFAGSDLANGRVPFNETAVFMTTPCMFLYPQNHRGIPNDYDSGLTYTNFPQCPWVGDVWKAWWAQNKSSATVAGLTAMVAGAARGASGGIGNAIGGLGGSLAQSSPVGVPEVSTGGGLVPMSGLMGSMVSGGGLNLSSPGPTGKMAIGATAGRAIGKGIGAIGGALGAGAAYAAGLLAKKADLERVPPQVHGQTQTDSLNAGMNRCGFTFYSMSIKAKQAAVIDSYFDRYGYATHENKVPNRNVRQNWTYTKTVDCTITGSIPADDAKAICNIYNHGITFWNNGNNVGKYNLSNKPTGGVG